MRVFLEFLNFLKLGKFKVLISPPVFSSMDSPPHLPHLSAAIFLANEGVLKSRGTAPFSRLLQLFLRFLKVARVLQWGSIFPKANINFRTVAVLKPYIVPIFERGWSHGLYVPPEHALIC